MPTQIQALQAFADTVQNPELAELKRLLQRFNLFEAVGVVRHELRHSDFLAFLLDPSQNHGLGTLFLSQFLQAVRRDAMGNAFLVDFDNLSKASIQREWHHIDILVIDDANRFGVVIENKIGTGEHSDQLNRYRAAFDSHYPGYKVLALYLTPDGDVPSSVDYQAVSYTLVCDVIEKIVRENRNTLDNEVIVVLEHYTQMLRRHIVSDSGVAELCRSILKQHKQALDLIFEHRRDQPAQIRDYLVTLVHQQNSLTAYSYGRSWVNFSLRDWDASLAARGLTLETITFPYLAFSDISKGLTVGVWVSPGKPSDRDRILQLAKDNPLTGVAGALGGGRWVKLTSFNILSLRDYERPPEEIEAIILERWSSFLQDELPRITEAFQKAEWLWASP